MNKRPSFAAFLGLARSLLTYYAIPGRAAAWGRFYRQFVRPGQLCFDIGAHVGNRTGALLAIGASVVAVEPQILFARTVRRIYNKSTQVTLLPVAVGGQAGSTEMLVSSRTPTVSTLSEAWAEQVGMEPSFSSVDWDQRQSVEVTTLDALIAQYGLPVFCKLDIEGYEFEALHGLSRPIFVISFEYLPSVIERALSCIDRLMELGDYRFNLIEGEYPKLAMPDWATAAELMARLRAKPSYEHPGEIVARLQTDSRTNRLRD